MSNTPRAVFLLLVTTLLSTAALAQCSAANGTVVICAPASGSTVGAGFHVSGAAASTAGISTMKVYLDGVSVFQSSTGSVETDLTTSAGSHRLSINAWDKAGAVLKATENFTASTSGGSGGGGGTGGTCTLSTVSPSVTICSPADGATVGTEVTVIGKTTDSAAVSTMKVYLDGVVDYTFHDNHIETDLILTVGPHRMTVKAWDAAGRVFSKTINITAQDDSGGGGGTGGSCSASTANPSVTICAPADGATVTSPVAVSAVTHSSTTVKAMKIYLDGVSVFQNSSGSINSNITVASGSHRLTVKAWNATTSFSSTVNITVGSGTAPPPPPPSGITPSQATVAPGGSVQFTSSDATAWQVDTIEGGNSTVGAIDSTGLYTAPSAAGDHTITATAPQPESATVHVRNIRGMLTAKYNTLRTGWNSEEATLTTSNVKSSTFGRLASYPVDGNVYGQPLVATGVNIAGQGPRNVVYVATEHDSVYAFDADADNSTPFWHVNFTNPGAGITTMPSADTGTTCCIAPEIGITSTPVIDAGRNLIYVVAATKESGKYFYKVHALDLGSGKEMLGGPVAVNAAVQGSAPEHDSAGLVHLNPLRHIQRAGLLLANDRVYAGFASFNDIHPYHGWVVAFDADTLAQTAVFNATPDGWGGGIWQSGGGLAADESGNIYAGIGNGTVALSSGNFSQTVVKLSPDLKVLDYFTSSDYANQNKVDQDLGTGCPLLLPPEAASTRLIVCTSKASNIYVLNRDSMGHLGPAGDTQIVQKLTNATGLSRSTPTYANGRVYVNGLDDFIKVFTVSGGKLSTSPVAKSAFTFPFPGTSVVVSSNDSTNGIVWALRHSGGPAILYAFDAVTMKELYDSSQAGSRDTAGQSIRFAVPTVVNGRVYVGGKASLTIYGLLQ